MFTRNVYNLYMSKSMLLENYARMITDIASENLGEEIVLLNTGEISLFSEFSIIITGQTDRHLENLSQKIIREMKKNGKKIHHKEGSGKTGWILLDYFGLCVHILSPFNANATTGLAVIKSTRLEKNGLSLCSS